MPTRLAQKPASVAQRALTARGPVALPLLTMTLSMMLSSSGRWAQLTPGQLSQEANYEDTGYRFQ
jgi:hypothetical protein